MDGSELTPETDTVSPTCLNCSVRLTLVPEVVDLGAETFLPELNDDVTAARVVLPPAAVLLRHVCPSEVTGHRSAVTSQRAQATGHRPQVSGQRSQVRSQVTSVTGHRLGHRPGHRSAVTDQQSQVSGHRSAVTGQLSQVSGNRSAVTVNRSQVTCQRAVTKGQGNTGQ